MPSPNYKVGTVPAKIRSFSRAFASRSLSPCTKLLRAVPRCTTLCVMLLSLTLSALTQTYKTLGCSRPSLWTLQGTRSSTDIHSMLASPERCVPDSDVAAVRCCSANRCVSVCSKWNERALPTWFEKKTAVYPKTCLNGLVATMQQARDECAAQGMALCSVKQLKDGLCCNTGCDTDVHYVWTADTCGGLPAVRNERAGGRVLAATSNFEFDSCMRSLNGARPASVYCRFIHDYRGIFGNSMDYSHDFSHPSSSNPHRLGSLGMMDAFVEAATSGIVGTATIDVFSVGMNDGRELEGLTGSKWYDHQRHRIHGWEIGLANYKKAATRMRGHPEARLHHAGVSASNGSMWASASEGPTADLRPTSSGHGSVRVPVVAWADYVAALGIKRVAYALIDTEGHEVSVVQGMRLERNRHVFPVFQYELGNTWLRKNRATSWTEKDMAEYLEALSYRLFLIGSMRRAATGRDEPVLLPFNASAYSGREWGCPGYFNFGSWHGLVADSFSVSGGRGALFSPRTKLHGVAVDDGGTELNLIGNMLVVQQRALHAWPWLAKLIEHLSVTP